MREALRRSLKELYPASEKLDLWGFASFNEYELFLSRNFECDISLE